MAGCGKGSFFIGLDFRTGSTFEQAELYVFNVCRISCLGILITSVTHISGLRGKRSEVRFLCNEHKNGHKNTLYACVYAYAYVTASLTSAESSYAYACAGACVAREDQALKERSN